MTALIAVAVSAALALLVWVLRHRRREMPAIGLDDAFRRHVQTGGFDA